MFGASVLSQSGEYVYFCDQTTPTNGTLNANGDFCYTSANACNSGAFLLRQRELCVRLTPGRCILLAGPNPCDPVLLPCVQEPIACSTGLATTAPVYWVCNAIWPPGSIVDPSSGLLCYMDLSSCLSYPNACSLITPCISDTALLSSGDGLCPAMVNRQQMYYCPHDIPINSTLSRAGVCFADASTCYASTECRYGNSPCTKSSTCFADAQWACFASFGGAPMIGTVQSAADLASKLAVKGTQIITVGAYTLLASNPLYILPAANVTIVCAPGGAVIAGSLLFPPAPSALPVSGGRCVLDAGGLSQHFVVGRGANLALINVTLVNGLAGTARGFGPSAPTWPQNGGCIVAFGGTVLSLSGTTFINCSAPIGLGAALYSFGTVEGNVMAVNSRSLAGDAAYVCGSAGGVCQDCPRGWVLEADSGSCTPCVGLYWYNLTVCLPCPSSSRPSGAGAPSIAFCNCPFSQVRIWAPDGSTFTCEACPPGAYCPGGGDNRAYSQAGSWRSFEPDALDFFTCSPGNCLPEPPIATVSFTVGNALAAGTTTVITSPDATPALATLLGQQSLYFSGQCADNCAEGHTGPACGSCVTGYELVDSTCIKCLASETLVADWTPSKRISSAILTASAVAFVIAAYISFPLAAESLDLKRLLVIVVKCFKRQEGAREPPGPSGQRTPSKPRAQVPAWPDLAKDGDDVVKSSEPPAHHVADYDECDVHPAAVAAEKESPATPSKHQSAAEEFLRAFLERQARCPAAAPRFPHPLCRMSKPGCGPCNAAWARYHSHFASPSTPCKSSLASKRPSACRGRRRSGACWCSLTLLTSRLRGRRFPARPPHPAQDPALCV